MFTVDVTLNWPKCVFRQGFDFKKIKKIGYWKLLEQLFCRKKDIYPHTAMLSVCAVYLSSFILIIPKIQG